jgi:hypothetical protein
MSETPEMYALLYARWASLLAAGAIPESLRAATDFSNLAERQSDENALFARHRMLGASYMCLGELESASAELDQVIADYDSPRHAGLVTSYGVDLRVAARCFKSEVLWLQGFPDQARRSAAEGLGEAEALDHVNSVAMALHFCGLVAFLNRDRVAVRGYARKMDELASRQPIGAWPSLIGAAVGWTLIEEGSRDEGMAKLVQGIELAVQAGVSMFLPFFYCRVAEALIEADRVTETTSYLAEVETIMARTGEENYRAEVLRLQGALLMKKHQHTTAEALFAEGIDVARRQGARAVELRVATTYAEFLAGRGEPARATSLLAPFADRIAGRDDRDAVSARTTLARTSAQRVAR